MYLCFLYGNNLYLKTNTELITQISCLACEVINNFLCNVELEKVIQA